MPNRAREATFEFLDPVEDGIRLAVWTEEGCGGLKLATSDGDLQMQGDGKSGLLRAVLHPCGDLYRVGIAEPGWTVGVGRFFPCGRVYRHASFRLGRWLVFWEGDFLVFRRASAARAAWRHMLFLGELGLSNREGARKALLVRVAAAICRVFRRRRLWLVSDRMDSGGDSGETLFRFLVKNLPDVDVRFVVSAASSAFGRLKGVGPVVPSGSPRRKLLTLQADCLVSSQAERAFSNPFEGYSEPYRDLLARVPVVFLQHGVIKDDLSAVLCRRVRNFAGFVVSAPRERDSILDGAYGYDADAVWLTGLPRFDELESHPENRVLIMPTWRLSLMDGQDKASGRWLLGDDFEKSRFCEFYRALLTDGRLLDACRRKGYRISFALHPNMMDARRFFTGCDVVEICDGVQYRDMFSAGSLLVTDYSSTAFDFAYLRKPVVYAHFDADAFFSGGHTYSRGYFDYVRDGFGEVETTLDAVVGRIVGYLEAGCSLRPEYRARIDGFFAFSGAGSCRRVADRIVQLTEKKAS